MVYGTGTVHIQPFNNTNNMKLQILVGFILVILTVIVAKRVTLLGSNGKQKYCGRHLDEIYSLVCQGPTAARNKRSDTKEFGWSYDDYSLDNNYDDDSANIAPIFRAFGYNNNAQLYERRKKQSLVDKCCYQPCSRADIEPYCWY